MRRACVIGAGSWGTAFCGVISANVGEVDLWAHSGAVAESIRSNRVNPRYLTSYHLPPNVRPTTDLGQACKGAELAVLALPSNHLRATCRSLAPHLAPTIPVIVLTKGIEPATGMLMSEVAADELGGSERVCALSGPNHAEEVCVGMPSAAVLAAPVAARAEMLRDVVSTPSFRVYTTSDLRGTEVCGAVKNVMALACGIAAGKGAGDNTLALIMTRGIAEIGRLVSAVGGDPMTCMGLAGMGDLVATCTSEHSRNRRFGEAFARGVTLEEFERDTHMVVEGARAVVSVRELAHAHGVEVPLCDAVRGLTSGRLTFDQVSERLMDRLPTTEFYGMGEGADAS